MKTLTLNHIVELPYGVQEAMNRLRVNFGFCGKEFKKVIITSSLPDEGKSFISFHLWRMLAESGKRVVLVDADIRRSMLRSIYQLSAEDSEFAGLAHYLSGQVELNEVVYATNLENAFLVPVVYTISNPALLLQNGRMEEMLNKLAEAFDYVLVDTPPLANVSDGEMIASICDGALLVVRSGTTTRSVVATSIKQLARANCRLMGTVLSRVERENSKYYYKQYYGYGYGYGYGEESDGEHKKRRSRKGDAGKEQASAH